MISPSITLDPTTLQNMIESAVNDKILTAVEQLCNDPAWLEKTEKLFTQAAVQRTVASIGQIDFSPIVRDQVDQCMTAFKKSLLSNFASTGIEDHATNCQLTIMDDTTVVENKLVAKELEIVGVARVKNLIVTGSINTDNRSWNELIEHIGTKTLDKISSQWQQNLVDQVQLQIQQAGIDFEKVNIGGEPLIDGNKLSNHVTETRIQSVGHLKDLTVRGEVHMNNNTVNVLHRRLGVNTSEPEMALSVWDEEVSVVIGKHKANQAYIGTSRTSGVAIGVNRIPQIELDLDGLTTVKKLRVGLHKIGHDTMVPGWSGTRGDIIFNSNPGSDGVFAWICLGGHKWKALKSAE
jgi:hypothetical protein